MIQRVLKTSCFFVLASLLLGTGVGCAPTDALPAGTARPPAAEGQAPVNASSAAPAAEQLAQYESILEHYFRNDPIAAANKRDEELVNSHNVWIEEGKTACKAQETALLKEKEEITAVNRQIEAADKELATLKRNADDGGGVDAYNAAVVKRNAIVSRQKKMAHALKSKWADLKKEMDRFQTAIDSASKRLERARTELEQQVDHYNTWRSEEQDLTYYHAVNELYATLHRKATEAGGATGETAVQLNKVREIRKELSELAFNREANTADGMILVKAKINGLETCCMLVDTGASLVTIPASIVSVLGLTDRIGKEITVSLPGGIQIKARELVIPSVSVFGKEAKDIEAVVLNESMVGIDGLLGLSFMDRFAYKIDGTADPKLSLRPKE